MSNTDPDLTTLARMEAIAGVTFLLAERVEAVDMIVDGSDEPALLARQAINLAHGLLVTLVPADRRDAILTQLTAAAVNQAGQ